MFLLIALLAGVLWLMSAAAAGLAKIILMLFLVLFVIALLLRGRKTGKL